ncbi:hypothetical protein A3K63_04500 [Candidatus Micrarchaeota archaeon RBG_16_49_10]|nr:MAG: hypothetical protein A3K63_04500 [Candidatus Micrarchaeota archaeon RBG_16_49_10]
MICGRCHSHRTIRFIDGFGSPRMFCKSCYSSVRMTQDVVIASQRRLMDFARRWDNETIGNVPTNFPGR